MSRCEEVTTYRDVPTSWHEDVPTSRREGGIGVLNPHNVAT